MCQQKCCMSVTKLLMNCMHGLMMHKVPQLLQFGNFEAGHVCLTRELKFKMQNTTASINAMAIVVVP